MFCVSSDTTELRYKYIQSRHQHHRCDMPPIEPRVTYVKSPSNSWLVRRWSSCEKTSARVIPRTRAISMSHSTDPSSLGMVVYDALLDLVSITDNITLRQVTYVYCYCKLLCLQNQLSRLYLLSILEHIHYCIIDEMFGGEVMQSDTRSFNNEGICYSSHKVKKMGDIGITNNGLN